jgi:hypothetical protein
VFFTNLSSFCSGLHLSDSSDVIAFFICHSTVIRKSSSHWKISEWFVILPKWSSRKWGMQINLKSVSCVSKPLVTADALSSSAVTHFQYFTRAARAPTLLATHLTSCK